MKIYYITVSGYLAHFRRPTSNTGKQTYRIPTRTFIAGFIAGGIGLNPDSYYTLFHPSQTKIGVEVHSNISVRNIPKNLKGFETTNTVSIGNKEFKQPRYKKESTQRVNYEYIRNPEYTIYIKTDSENLQEGLENIRDGKWVYPPYLGKNNCGATIKDVGVVEGSQITEGQVDTVIPNPAIETVNPGENISLNTEVYPTNFKEASTGRTPYDYITVYYTKDASISPTITASEESLFIKLKHKNILLY